VLPDELEKFRRILQLENKKELLSFLELMLKEH